MRAAARTAAWLWWRTPTIVPLLGEPRDTPCHRRAHAKGERPIPRVDEPAETASPPPSREGRRHPDDQGAFHRSDGRRRSPGSLQVPSCVGLPLTPPTRSPRSVERCFFGHCKRSTRGSLAHSIREDERLCQPAGLLMPGTDDPSTPTWPDWGGRRRKLIAPLAPPPVAAPLRLLRPRVPGAMCQIGRAHV